MVAMSTTHQSFFDQLELDTETPTTDQLAELFRAHTSPAFTRACAIHAGIDYSFPADAPKPTDGDESSTCLRVSSERGSNGTGKARADSRATEAIRAALGRDRQTQRQVLALIKAGEVPMAYRLAGCGQRSVELECGSCGSKDNYIPISCNVRVCERCMRRRMGRAIGQYRDEVASWDNPAMLTVTQKNVPAPEEGVERIRYNFVDLFLNRTIPTEGGEGGMKWEWKTTEGAAWKWKQGLIHQGRHELARRLQKRYVEQGRQIPVSEIIPTGFYGIDSKEQEPGQFAVVGGEVEIVEPGRYHVHIHALVDLAWTPQPALSAVWEDVTDGDCILDVRSFPSTEAAVAETVGYATKAPEFESAEAEVAFTVAMKNKSLVQPFGDLHGNSPDVNPALICAHCGEEPLWWVFRGVVDGQYDTIELAGSSADGDRPPDESDENTDTGTPVVNPSNPATYAD